MFDETLTAELDRALDTCCLLTADVSHLREAKHKAAFVTHFGAWLYRQRRALYRRAEVQTGAIEAAVDRYFVSLSSPIDEALHMLVDCDLTPRYKANVQRQLWDAIDRNWAALAPSCVRGSELVFDMDD
jgi:hypothetical protein